MGEVLLLRLDAPLMSFGGVTVDSRGVTQAFPSLSLLTGLIGNALGYDHRDSGKLSSLQDRIRYAARCDVPGRRLTDFQTVDLGQPHLVDTGWTTRGVPEERGKGEATSGTHIRNREHWADAVFTVALALRDPTASPTLAEIERALNEPERPLFIGRKTCLPATRLFLARREVASLREALEAEPLETRARRSEVASEAVTLWLPEDEEVEGRFEEMLVTDERDWENQIVVGQRIVRQTTYVAKGASRAG